MLRARRNIVLFRVFVEKAILSTLALKWCRLRYYPVGFALCARAYSEGS